MTDTPPQPASDLDPAAAFLGLLAHLCALSGPEFATVTPHQLSADLPQVKPL